MVLLFLASLLVVEFGAEYYGAPRLANFLMLTPVAEGIKLALFLAAATFVIFHYQSEMKKPEYEFRFAIGLLTLMSKQRQGTVVNSLQIFHTLFTKADISNISAYTHKDNKLTKHSCYSKNPSAVFPSELPIETSVAGRALSDGAARYAPRLFMPNTKKHGWQLYMPHALKFKFTEVNERQDVTGGGSGSSGVSFYRFESRPRVESGVFYGDRRNIDFGSLLSVPIKLGSDEEGCVGVLNFEFSEPSTLDAVDIAMASVYAIWFGKAVLGTGEPYIRRTAD